MLFTMRDRRALVPFIGFFEALIWVIAVAIAIQNLHSIWHILGYAGGFSAGTFVGLWIEGKIALGNATIRIVCRDVTNGARIADALREEGYGVTSFTGHGRDGDVEVIYTVVTRRQIEAVIREVEDLDRHAFISVEEPRSIRRGWMFPRRRS
jgi:uncharacterized protein YebE (UPF0316 family)